MTLKGESVMMKRRFLAIAAALACMAGSLPTAAFAASPWDEDAVYRVLEVDEKGNLTLEQLGGTTYTLSSCGADMDAIWATQEMAEVGDIVRLSKPGYVAEVVPGCLHFYKEEPAVLENLSKTEDLCKRISLTVTEENGYSYTMTDEEGNVYSYRDNTHVLVEATVGTVLDCLVYGEYVVVPELTGRFSTFIVVAADRTENPEHYVLYKPGEGTCYVSAETLGEYMKEERTLVCGDILRCDIKTFGIKGYETGNLIFALDGTGSEVVYAGSLYDEPQYAEFTVTQQRQTLRHLHLTNDEGTSTHVVDYLKYADGIWSDVKRSYIQSCETDILSLREGDRVTMLTFEGYPVLPYAVDPLGDTDGSGSLDILDVIVINRHILGAAELPAAKRAPGELGQADFNGNGRIDADDSLGMLKRIVGIG